MLLVRGGLLAACGGPALTADEIAARSGQTMAAVETLHFVMTVEGGPAYIDPEATLSLRAAEGDLKRPERVRATLKVGAAGLAIIEIQAIGIGDEQFLTRPVTGEWQRMPPGWGFDPGALFDPESGIEVAVTRCAWEEEYKKERLAAGRAYRLRGTASGEDLAPLTAWMITAEEVQVDAWVAQDDFHLLQLRIEEPPKEEGGHPTIWLLQFSAFDQPVTIERPPGF